MLTRDKVEKEYVPLYKRIGLGTTIWSPLKFGCVHHPSSKSYAISH
jgi:aryl-alcohol dehydrogenase-like predicted oxidoreductase